MKPPLTIVSLSVCEVAKLLENWSDQPLIGPADHQWSLHCVQNVVVHPGTVQKVCVSLPVLASTIERTQQLVQQLGLMDNKLLAQHSGEVGGA